MTFASVETSEFFEPVELFEFKRGVFSWLYTSTDSNVSFSGRTYLAEPIKRSSISSTQDIGKSTIKIKVSKNNDFVQQYIAQSPTDVIEIIITRIHRSDSDPAVTFKGRVINIAFEENEVVITCQPNLSSLRRPGLRRLYQTTCPHVLYGSQCTVTKIDFDILATITAISGRTLSATQFIVSINASFDADWFRGGVVEINQSGLVSKRFITDHDNAAGTITLNLPLPNIIVGDVVTAFPGCNHSTDSCKNKFINIDSYGGFPFIPQKNPMDGTSVF